MELSKNSEVQRKQVWIEAWFKAASVSEGATPKAITDLADSCLKAFDEHFPSCGQTKQD